jgi:5-methylcytosine-specific restriction endonuclease McrA
MGDKALDAMCRTLVRHRDHWTCQHCGSKRAPEWSHVKTREAKSIQWVPWNSMILCGPRINKDSCHNWWHTNVNEAMAWWREKFPDRALLLEMWQHDRHRPKLDRQATRLWLQQETAKIGRETL